MKPRKTAQTANPAQQQAGESTEGWTYFKLHYSGDGDLLTLLIASFADCAFSFTTSPKQAEFHPVGSDFYLFNFFCKCKVIAWLNLCELLMLKHHLLPLVFQVDTTWNLCSRTKSLWKGLGVAEMITRHEPYIFTDLLGKGVFVWFSIVAACTNSKCTLILVLDGT